MLVHNIETHGCSLDLDHQHNSNSQSSRNTYIFNNNKYINRELYARKQKKIKKNNQFKHGIAD